MNEFFDVDLFPGKLSEDEIFSDAAFRAAVHDMQLSGVEIPANWE